MNRPDILLDLHKVKNILRLFIGHLDLSEEKSQCAVTTKFDFNLKEYLKV